MPAQRTVVRVASPSAAWRWWDSPCVRPWPRPWALTMPLAPLTCLTHPQCTGRLTTIPTRECSFNRFLRRRPLHRLTAHRLCPYRVLRTDYRLPTTGYRLPTTANWLCFSEAVRSRIIRNSCRRKHLHHLGPAANWVCFAQFTWGHGYFVGSRCSPLDLPATGFSSLTLQT